jgi:hypothetical protein
MTWIKTAVLTALCCAAASATSITFTEVINNASGSLDGTTFTSQTVTLVLTSDTSTIVNNGGGFYTDTGTATVSVSGGGSDTFTDTMRAFVLQGGPTAGILDGTEHLDVLDVNNAGFATYALNTAIGPLSGGTTGNSGDTYATTGGTFGFTSPLNVDHPASFTAATSSAPEPGTLGLIGASIGFLLLRRARS